MSETPQPATSVPPRLPAPGWAAAAGLAASAGLTASAGFGASAGLGAAAGALGCGGLQAATSAIPPVRAPNFSKVRRSTREPLNSRQSRSAT